MVCSFAAKLRNMERQHTQQGGLATRADYAGSKLRPSRQPPPQGNGTYIRNRTELSRKVEVWNEGWSLQVEIKVSHLSASKSGSD